MATTPLLHQRCLNHGLREAVGRCPECRQFFCRECVTEHNDRLICSGCLKKLSRPAARTRLRLASLGRVVAAFAGVAVLWLCFYGLGRLLLAVPASFHEGTLWKVNFWDQEP